MNAWDDALVDISDLMTRPTNRLVTGRIKLTDSLCGSGLRSVQARSVRSVGSLSSRPAHRHALWPLAVDLR
jgi:hypothetical protein